MRIGDRHPLGQSIGERIRMTEPLSFHDFDVRVSGTSL